MPSIRRPAVAGGFYPLDEARLRAEVARHLAQAGRTGEGAPPKLVVVPHAGYVYSGPVAAHAYAALAPLRGRIRRVVLLGPTHRVPVRGLAAPGVDAFETPLGRVPIDREALEGLAGLPQLVQSDAAHAFEHSLEVQLPFLQTVLGEFALVPLAVGAARPDEVAAVIDRLWGGDETLVVVSTDLSHYLPQALARETDAATVGRILALDATISHDEACGATPLNGALGVARARGLQARLLDLRTSGDTAGDRDAGAATPRMGERRTAIDGRADHASVLHRAADASLGRALLARARNAIAVALELPLLPEAPHPALARPGASFVSLSRRGQLRGCIGRLEADGHSLEEDVRRNAQRAAFEDPRFPPLSAQEWPGLEVEVSLIGALEPMAVATEPEAISRLRPFEDGIVLDWRGRRATFLPQVWEQLPAAEDFLAALRRKAGLPADFWHAEVAMFRYRVDKFVEPGRPA